MTTKNLVSTYEGSAFMRYGRVAERIVLILLNTHNTHDVDSFNELVCDLVSVEKMRAYWESICHHCRCRCRTRVLLSRSVVKLQRDYGWRVRTRLDSFDWVYRLVVIMYYVD